ncbi:MAG: biotin-dependent carboxyltransferase family protein, partial [Candidatus Binatia bacterium]
GAERPTTGGYTKIATVIGADFSLVAQAKPGDRLRFSEVSVDAARASWRRHEELLDAAVREIE